MKNSVLKCSFLCLASFLIISLTSCDKQVIIGKISRTTDKTTGDETFRKMGDQDKWYASEDHHGSIREWYGSETEPADCHIVLYTPGTGVGGGPQEILCAGCKEGHVCVLKAVVRVEDNEKKVEELYCVCE